jgi:hypothetical protein
VSSFETAYVATLYLLGARGQGAALSLAEPTPEAERFERALLREERPARAQLLAREVAAVLAALEARAWR